MRPDSRQITGWIRPNLWNEFLGNPTTSFSSETGFLPFHADLGGLWSEINTGVDGGFAYTGKVGLRVTW